MDGSEVGDCFADGGRDGRFGGDVALDVDDFGICFLLWGEFEVVGCDVDAVGWELGLVFISSGLCDFVIPASSSAMALPIPPRAPVTKAWRPSIARKEDMWDG